MRSQLLLACLQSTTKTTTTTTTTTATTIGGDGDGDVRAADRGATVLQAGRGVEVHARAHARGLSPGKYFSKAGG